MEIVQIFYFYILWHYTKSWKDITRVVLNFLWFIFNFFSIDLLGQTLFSPWRRLSEQAGGGTGLFGAFIVTTLMRVIGFFIRLLVIFVGFVVLAAAAILSISFYVVWALLPVIVFIFFFAGLGKFTKAVIF